MIPESIRAEIEAKGGLVGSPEPQGNGTTIYRAASGDYVVVDDASGQPRMRGFAPPQDGTQSAAAPAQALAPAASAGGGGMNQQQIEAWIAQNGGAGGVQYNNATKTVDNPASDPLTAKAAGVKFDPTAPDKITVTEESWTNSKTGATLRVARKPDNSFDVLENKGADPNKPTTGAATRPTNVYVGTNPTTGKPTQVSEYPDGRKEYDDTAVPAASTDTPATRAALEDEREMQWNANPANIPQGASGRRETHRARDERLAKEKKDAADKEAATKKADDTTVVDVTYTGTGKNRKKVITYKSGRKATEASPTNATEIETKYDPVTGKKTVRYDDGTTATFEREPEAGSLGRPIPANAPKFVPDYSQDDLGLTAYNDQLMAAQAAGVITKAEGKQLIEQAGGLATQTASHGTTLRGQVATARGQDITQRSQDLGEVQSRRADANSMYTGLKKGYDDLALKLMGGEGGLAAEAFRSALELGRENAAAWGGMTDVPQVPPSMLAATRGAASTQIEIQPGGQISVSPAGAAPLAGGQPTDATPGQGGQNVKEDRIAAQPVAATPGIPGDTLGLADPYSTVLQGARAPQAFVPDRAALRAQFPDATDEEIDEAIRGVGAAA